MGKERLWRKIRVERLWVPEFSYPHTLDDGEDKLCSLAPCCLVGAAVGALGLVYRFRARADDGCGIVINCRVIGSDTCWFGRLGAIARFVSCHCPNEKN